jgi:flagellar hook assembly protein FlgD
MGDKTVISFTVAKYGDVKLRILDLSGRQVALLANERMSPGKLQILWDGKNDRGESVSAGVYVYDLTAPGFRASRRLVRIR